MTNDLYAIYFGHLQVEYQDIVAVEALNLFDEIICLEKTMSFETTELYDVTKHLQNIGFIINYIHLWCRNWFCDQVTTHVVP